MDYFTLGWKLALRLGDERSGEIELVLDEVGRGEQSLLDTPEEITRKSRDKMTDAEFGHLSSRIRASRRNEPTAAQHVMKSLYREDNG